MDPGASSPLTGTLLLRRSPGGGLGANFPGNARLLCRGFPGRGLQSLPMVPKQFWPKLLGSGLRRGVATNIFPPKGNQGPSPPVQRAKCCPVKISTRRGTAKSSPCLRTSCRRWTALAMSRPLSEPPWAEANYSLKAVMGGGARSGQPSSGTRAAWCTRITHLAEFI